MPKALFLKTLAIILALASSLTFAADASANLGPFEATPTSAPSHPGSATTTPPAKFTLSASGENMWLSSDAFHSV
jgi:hypothetical protein